MSADKNQQNYQGISLVYSPINYIGAQSRIDTTAEWGRLNKNTSIVLDEWGSWSMIGCCKLSRVLPETTV